MVLCICQKVSSFQTQLLKILNSSVLAFGPKGSNIPITQDGIGGINYLKQGIDELIRLIDASVEQYEQFDWREDWMTRAGIALYDYPTIGTHDYIDLFADNSDFSSDILARAQFYAENGY